MIPKYTVEYTAQFKKHAHPNHYTTDDPVACEEFVEELLERVPFERVQDRLRDALEAKIVGNAVASPTT